MDAEVLPSPVTASLALVNYASVFEAFKEVAGEATKVRSPESVDELLRLVGRRICELIDAGRCSVYLRADGGLFHGQVGYSASGRIDDRIKPLVAGVEEDRFTQEIVQTRAPVLVTDARHDARTLQRTMRRWSVQDMLGVPLVVDDTVIGIIYIDKLDRDHVYSDRELHVAQTFASLAASAIHQASLLAQLSGRSAVIARQRETLQQAADAHERLTRAVLSGLGADDIVGLLADLLRRPVLALSDRLEPMAVAAPDQAPVQPAWLVAARGAGEALVSMAVRRVVRTKSSVILPPAGDLGCPYRRLVCPMLVQGHVVGYLVVLDKGAPFTALDDRIGQHGATVLTLQLFNELRQAAARTSARSEFLGDLLHGGRDVESLHRRGRVLGVDTRAPHLVVHVSGASVGDAAEGELLAHLARLLARESGLDEVLTTGVPGGFVVLLPLPHGCNDVDAMREAKQLVTEALLAVRPDGSLSTVISSVCRCPADYAKAHAETRKMTEMLERFASRGRVDLVSELGVLRLLATAASQSELLGFARDLLVPLMAHDRETQGDLVSTLRCFLDHGGQVRNTAKALGVHENTVRYRLARVSKLSFVDPERFESLLDLRLALQVIDIVGEPASGGSTAPETATPARPVARS
ncbi:helix-turn-helix domain-containing protein [Geodermatophilus amargosae]|uniref:helix-turn-helix domain-containing protein n=1 Tax=Geodermatophilus amargosae TaxID=1296565 RepID=UPI0034DF83AF